MKSLRLLITSLLILASSVVASPAFGGGILWGVMDWMNNANAFPDTDTSTSRPLFSDGDAHMVTHQYQGANWLSFKVSQQNKDEVERIYDAGHCINLMLYFVSCTYDAQTDSFSYPLTDAFLDDFGDLVDAYKIGGGPLYIQAFPEFELWYADKSAAVQEKYRAKIRSQFDAMATIARAKYDKAYIGLCFMGLFMADADSSFYTRWDPVISNSDLVYINFMTPFTKQHEHARRMVKSTKLIHDNWGKPICFPFFMLWDDTNTPIFGREATYSEDAASFSDYISEWISRTMTAPAEIEGSTVDEWRTNLTSLQSRGLFAFSLYSANYCNKPNTPQDPSGNTHSLASYSDLISVMTATARTNVYPPADITSDESYHLVNQQSDKHLHESSAAYSGNPSGKYAITFPAGSGWNSQKWKFVGVGSGNFRLVNWQSSNVLHESSETYVSDSSGQYVITFPWNGWNTQRWKPVLLPGGEHRLESVDSGKVLHEASEIYSGSSDGNMVISFPYNGWNSQKWSVIPSNY
ncbi:MAG: RICIN domain-containing protein [Opitutales bacterium]